MSRRKPVSAHSSIALSKNQRNRSPNSRGREVASFFRCTYAEEEEELFVIDQVVKVVLGDYTGLRAIVPEKRQPEKLDVFGVKLSRHQDLGRAVLERRDGRRHNRFASRAERHKFELSS